MSEPIVVDAADGVQIPNVNTDVITAAAVLRARGLALCRVNPETKRASDAGWTTRSVEPHELRPGDLIGVQGGPLSHAGKPGHALVVLDLDSADAVRLAD